MSTLSFFLAENVKPTESVKYVASSRFTGGDGKPVAWELKPITSDMDERLRKDCVRNVPVVGKKGQIKRETDIEQYLGRLAVACTVDPNLNNAELQASWKVNGADALLKAMLMPGEYANYLAKIQEICGFDTSIQDEVDEAKN